MITAGCGSLVIEHCSVRFAGDGADDQDTGEEGDAVSGEPLREQDRFLPIANVARIMKKSIPNTGKVRQTSTLTKK